MILEEVITTPAIWDNSFTPKPSYIHNSKIAVKLKEIFKNKIKYLLLMELSELFCCLWIRYMLMWVTGWFYIKILFIGSESVE